MHFVKRSQKQVRGLDHTDFCSDESVNEVNSCMSAHEKEKKEKEKDNRYKYLFEYECIYVD